MLAARSQLRFMIALVLPRGWLPREFGLNQVTLRGAGPWYTVLTGPGVGLFGDYQANENQTYPANADGRHVASARVQVYDCGNIFSIKKGSGNSGWSKTVRDNLQELASPPADATNS